MTLIRRWSMAGALEDVSKSFETAPSPAAPVADPADEPAAAAAPILLKAAGADDWRPLLAEPAL